LLSEYTSKLDVSLKRWKSYDGKIGELVVFHYGLEEDQRVQGQFPALQSYELKRDAGKMYVSVQAVYDRMQEIHMNKTDRTLHRHAVMPVV